MRAIQNFHHQDVIDLEREGDEVNTKDIGRIYENGIQFKPAEIEFITRHYRLLYHNRQNKLAEIKRMQHIQRSYQKQKLPD
jgi:hypothetical protein